MMKLFDFQVTGKNFLQEHSYAMLCDEMGLGKTAQAIVAAEHLKHVLVVCPACARINWQREFWKWDKRVIGIAQGPADYQKKSTIVSYDYISKHPHLFNSPVSPRWDVLILDESHFLKEPTAQRTQKILGTNGVIHKARRCWSLSGTPAPNHAGELWRIFNV